MEYEGVLTQTDEEDFVVGDELCIHGVWFKISVFTATEEGSAVVLEEVPDEPEFETNDVAVFQDQHLWEPVSTSATLVEEEETYWFEWHDTAPSEFNDVWNVDLPVIIPTTDTAPWLKIDVSNFDQNWVLESAEVHTDPYGDHRLSEPYSNAGRWCYTCNRWERNAHHG